MTPDTPMGSDGGGRDAEILSETNDENRSVIQPPMGAAAAGPGQRRMDIGGIMPQSYKCPSCRRTCGVHQDSIKPNFGCTGVFKFAYRSSSEPLPRLR